MNSIIVLCLITAFCWSLSPVIYKIAMNDLPQCTVVVFSAFVYGILALLYFTYHREEVVLSLNAQSSTSFYWLILVNIAIFIGQLLYVHSLSKEKSYIVSSITYTSPLFTLLLAWLILKEDVRLINFIGVITIVAGTLLLIK